MKNSESMVMEFELYCENKWKKNFIETEPYVGSLFGFFIFSSLADNWGRKPSICLSWFIASIGAIIMAFSVNF